MQLEQIAVLFVFIGNAVSIMMLGFMLFKISKQTEATHSLLVNGTRDLLEAGKRLRDSTKSTDRLVDRLSDLNQQPSSAPPPAASETEEHFRKLESMLQELSGKKLPDHGKFLEDIRQVLDSIGNQSGTDSFAQWRDAHQHKLEAAQTQRTRMAAEMEALKTRLDESQKVIVELRRTVRVAETANQSTEALRVSLDQQQQLLARAKERAQAAESRAATLSREIELMQAEAGRAESKGDGASAAVRRQLDEVTRERDGLKGQLEKLRETMQRTLIEKDFIEEKLLDLDAAAHASVTAAAQAASSPPQAGA